MRIEFSDGCASCDRRPACEIAGQRLEKYERAAAQLGYTVTEGSLTCSVRTVDVEGSPIFTAPDPCGARLRLPVLASFEERDKIATLAALDSRVGQIVPNTRALALEVTGETL